MVDAFRLDDLVALSACNTGSGEEIKGDGVRGLTRAFMYASTQTVSVTFMNSRIPLR
jgi:CHAT domain-containing protein